MQTKVSKRFYEEGFRLEGEGKRVDVVDLQGKKYFEIFYLGKNNILIMDCKGYWWAEQIIKINICWKGDLPKPNIHWIRYRYR